MVNRQAQAEEKGIRLASVIQQNLIPFYGKMMTFRVLTVQNTLTKVIIRRIMEEPDAVGQGGGAPPG